MPPYIMDSLINYDKCITRLVNLDISVLRSSPDASREQQECRCKASPQINVNVFTVNAQVNVRVEGNHQINQGNQTISTKCK